MQSDTSLTARGSWRAPRPDRAARESRHDACRFRSLLSSRNRSNYTFTAIYRAGCPRLSERIGYLIQRVVDLLRKNIACHTGGRWNILDKIILWTAGIYDFCHRSKLVESVFWQASRPVFAPQRMFRRSDGSMESVANYRPVARTSSRAFLLKPIADNKAQSPART